MEKKERKPAGYWDYEHCLEEAKKHSNITSFADKAYRAYYVAKKNGWMKDYTWFKKPEAHNKKWYYNTCKEEALKYRTKAEFQRGSSGAYDAARDNGWLSDYTWFESNRFPNGYWGYEHCYEEAKKYSCLSEFERSNGSAYNVALKNGWLDEYTWFETPILKELDTVSKIHTVYVYEDADNKVAYVGRSKNWKKRHNGHKRTIKGKSDGLKTHFDSIGKEIPMPIILEEGLTAEESRDREDYWKNYYANNGWRMLNKAATGKNRGSLGGGFRKWNREACYEEAKKYKSITEFLKGSPGAHDAAYRNGWLKDYTWFLSKAEAMSKARTKWNYETCCEEAKKYTSRGEFSKKSSTAWSRAKKKGWIDECGWLVPKRKPAGYWTYERCKEEALKCSTMTGFYNSNLSAYVISRNNGWLKDYTWLLCSEKKPKNYWNNYDNCKEEALNYETKVDFQNGNMSAYTAARKNGWLNDFGFKELVKPKNYWNYETCCDEAKKYKSRWDFGKHCGGAYGVCLRNGWLDEFFPKAA